MGPLADTIAAATAILLNGGLVAFPTETVYGLGADATSSAAVSRLFAAKGRPTFNPLIAHVATLEQAHDEGLFDADAERLAAAFWPGPLTLVLPRRAGGSVCDLACAGLATLGLRMPDHPDAAALLAACGRPIVAPSANRSGRLSPTRREHVEAELAGLVDLVIDAGLCAFGVESTIVACADGRISLLRPGGITRAALETVLGRRVSTPSDGTIRSPGMMASHYAPNALIRLDATHLEAGESGLDFHGALAAGLDLSPTGDLREAAANLFGYLRRLDDRGPRLIAVAPIPNDGLGEAINDRLRRAAAPRET